MNIKILAILLGEHPCLVNILLGPVTVHYNVLSNLSLHILSFTAGWSLGEHPQENIDWGSTDHRQSISESLKLKLWQYPSIHTNYMLHHCSTLQI